MFQWQHVAPGTRLHGEEGLQEVIHQIGGFEAAASSWERFILPSRMAKYDPELLDRLCLNGSVMWARLSPHPRFAAIPSMEDESARRRIVPTSVAPVGIFPREDGDWLMRLASGESPGIDRDTVLTPVAQDIRRLLQERGASFFADIARETGHLQSQVEDALWELSAAGVVTADGFDNLRALLDPKRRQGREKSKRPRHGAGRWSLLASRRVEANPADQAARQFLRRYGVVFRDLLARESIEPVVARSARAVSSYGVPGRDSRRPLRGWIRRRAVRAARSGGIPARDAARRSRTQHRDTKSNFLPRIP